MSSGRKAPPGEPAGGDEYWIYSIAYAYGGGASVAAGMNDQSFCEMSRRETAKTYTVSRECARVGVRFLDQR